jgi:YHS domain-containing protein
VILRILQILLILAVIRALWRLGKGMLEGAGYQRVDGPKNVGVKLERDPVCGTYVSPSTALVLRMGGETRYFCSDRCRRTWEKQ